MLSILSAIPTLPIIALTVTLQSHLLLLRLAVPVMIATETERLLLLLQLAECGSELGCQLMLQPLLLQLQVTHVIGVVPRHRDFRCHRCCCCCRCCCSCRVIGVEATIVSTAAAAAAAAAAAKEGEASGGEAGAGHSALPRVLAVSCVSTRRQVDVSKRH